MHGFFYLVVILYYPSRGSVFTLPAALLLYLVDRGAVASRKDGVESDPGSILYRVGYSFGEALPSR